MMSCRIFTPQKDTKAIGYVLFPSFWVNVPTSCMCQNMQRTLDGLFLFILQLSIGKQWKEFLDYNENIGFIFHVRTSVFMRDTIINVYKEQCSLKSVKDS